VIEGLPPGSYRIVQTVPFAAEPAGDDGNATDSRITIEAGKLTRVRLRSPR
jgi:hypothetical protein